MKLSLKIFLIGIIAILFIASIGAIASDKLNFSYSYLSIISFLIYASIAFITTRKVNKKTGIILATVLGFIDATIGWKISTLLGANTGSSSIEITPTIW